MKVRAIPETSPLYPLPEDYPDLSPEGQRKARVNAVRQWLLPGTDEERARRYISAIRFFDDWYLTADHEVEFDPLFYDQTPLSTPKGHFDIYDQWARNRLSIAIAPRGYAKSFCITKSILMEMVSTPRYGIVYATSSGDNTKQRGQAIKDQFNPDINERLAYDWAPECGGRLAPKRGEAPWGTTHMQLMNGAYLRCISAESKQRGMRPRLYILDDPEYDPKASTSMQIIRDYMDVLLFKMVLPMVMRAGCSARWLATFVSRRHYAWHAMDVDGEGRARDPRFNNWARMTIPSEYRDARGRIRSCWPEMWPATRDERLALARKDSHYEKVISLEEVKETIGVAHYLSEYMAKPGEGDEVFFPNLTEDEHGWWYEDVDEALDMTPCASNTRLCWKNDKGETKRVPLSTFLRQSRTFMTVDTSYSAGPDSDAKVCCLMALTADNELFVLDLWSGRCHQPRLIQETLMMADRWRCPSVHVEGIREGISVFNDLDSIVRQRASEMHGVSHLPKVAKFNPGMTEKTAKIASLGRRFEFGKIKLPLRRRNDHPWRDLVNQIEEFNPDARDGGLQHDDAIDCVSMSMFVIRGRVRYFSEGRTIDDRQPLERIRDGEYQDPDTGLPYAHMIDWRNVKLGDLMAVVDNDAPAPGGGGTRA